MEPVRSYSPVTASRQTWSSGAQSLTATKARQGCELVRIRFAASGDHGFRSRVADLMGWRRERISREQNGAEKLSVELILAAAAQHDAEGHPEEADLLLGPFQREKQSSFGFMK